MPKGTSESCPVKVIVRIRPHRKDLLEDGDEGWEYDTKTLKQKESHSGRAYNFDYVFTPDHSTVDLYNATLRGSVVHNALSGYNGTIFAYGQTGSGKSYTMLGSDNTPGVAPLFAADLFQHIERESSGFEFVVRVSAFEIFMEKLYDLIPKTDALVGVGSPNNGASSPCAAATPVDPFDPTSKSAREGMIRIETAPDGVHVVGLSEVVVCTEGELVSLLRGPIHSSRHVSATAMNDQSSRSHCIIRITIETFERSSDTPTARQRRLKDLGVGGESGRVTSKASPRVLGRLNHYGTTARSSCMYFVDLAGSEKLSKTEIVGASKEEATARKREGAEINTSLMTLCKVIRALAKQSKEAKGADGKGTEAEAEGEDGKKKGKSAPMHVVYRESVLTRVLQPALGGNSETAVICAVATAPQHSEETRNTLQFGTSAKEISNVLTKNEVRDASVAALTKELERAKAEVGALREEASALRDRIAQLETEIEEVKAGGGGTGGGGGADAAELEKAVEDLGRLKVELGSVKAESARAAAESGEREEALVQEIAKMNEEMEVLRADEEEADELVEQLGGKLKAAQSEAKKLKEAVAAAEARADAAESALARAKGGGAGGDGVGGSNGGRWAATASPAGGEAGGGGREGEGDPWERIDALTKELEATKRDRNLQAARVERLLRSEREMNNAEVGEGLTVIPVSVKGLDSRRIILRNDEDERPSTAGGAGGGSGRRGGREGETERDAVKSKDGGGGGAEGGEGEKKLKAKIAELEDKLAELAGQQDILLDSKLKRMQALCVRQAALVSAYQSAVIELCESAVGKGGDVR